MANCTSSCKIALLKQLLMLSSLSRAFCFFYLINIFCFRAASQNTITGKVDRGDFILHYTQYGQKGPYLVLLSGGPGSDVGYMKIIADSLQHNFKCILLEQRGTGRSVMKYYDSTNVRMQLYVDDLEALRNQLSTDKFILVGSSWGALLSLLYASYHPDQVDKIVILGAGPITSDYADIFDDNLRIRFTAQEREIRAFWRDKRKDSLLYVKANYERDKAGMPAYFYNRELGLAEANKLKITDVN